jgi:hypothetical protein
VTQAGFESVGVLTGEQISRFQNDGFLAVTQPLLPSEQVAFARDRIDGLFDRWSSLPPRLASRPFSNGAPSLIAKIHRVSAIDRVLAQCQLVTTCRRIAAAILGRRHVWCRFDSAIYKHPGAGSVPWHQDFALSTIGVPKRSVHFWIPLNDHTRDSGSLEFVPGSHLGGPAPHRVPENGSSVGKTTANEPDRQTVVSVPLSVGNLSMHTPWTIHSSAPNRGENVRKALILEFSSSPWSAVRQFSRPLVSALLVHSPGAEED